MLTKIVYHREKLSEACIWIVAKGMKRSCRRQEGKLPKAWKNTMGSYFYNQNKIKRNEILFRMKNNNNMTRLVLHLFIYWKWVRVRWMEEKKSYLLFSFYFYFIIYCYYYHYQNCYFNINNFANLIHSPSSSRLYYTPDEAIHRIALRR